MGSFLLIFFAGGLLANQAEAQANSPLDDLISNRLSDEEVRRELSRSFGLSLPVHLGCNSTARLEVTLPLTCEHRNFKVLVEDLGSVGANFASLIEELSIGPNWTSLWGVDKFDLSESLTKFSWEFDPTSAWSYSRSKSHGILCALGGPLPYQREAERPVFGVGRCYIAFNGTFGESRVIRLTFSDFGEPSLFGESSPSLDDVGLQVFISYFALNVYSFG